MKKSKLHKFNKFFFEFVSIFFAVISAFLLNNWNENRKNKLVENKILTEIYNGLESDSLDLVGDDAVYKIAFRGIDYFNKIIDGNSMKSDSLIMFYYLFSRDVLTVQNKSGYEVLKSKGLETIGSDSLRKEIIQLYEVAYELHRKFNEEYDENKFRQLYFDKINDVIAPNFTYDSLGHLSDITLPLNLEKRTKNLVKSYLWKIKMNKSDRYETNQLMKNKIGELRKSIKRYLKERR